MMTQLNGTNGIRVDVSEALRIRVAELRDGIAWAAFPYYVKGWRWSGAYANKIQRGAQITVPLEVYDVLQVQRPTIVITLENVDEVDISPAALAVLVRRLSLVACAVEKCDGRFYRMGNAKYCAAHSYATPEGRRWHRQRQNGR